MKTSIFWVRCYLWILPLCALVGCSHYRWGDSSGILAGRSLQIAPIEGDDLGILRSSLLYQLTRAGEVASLAEQGDLVLSVRILKISEEDVGFQYHRRRCGTGHRKGLVPNETRLEVSSEVLLCDSLSGAVVMGPCQVSASVDFDHTYYAAHHRINQFSLGQLNPKDEAAEVVMLPLCRALAEQIVLRLN